MSAHESASDHVDWLTPSSVFADLLPGVVFDLDPCASESAASCVPLARGWVQLATGGADHAWPHDRLVWLNPPYGRLGYPFLARMVQHALAGGSGVALLPVRTDTAWWHQSIGLLSKWHAPLRLVFLRGRVSFIDSRTGQPAGSPAFPSCLVFWGAGWPQSVIQRAGVASQLLRDAGPLLGDLSDALMVGQDVRTLMGPGWRVYTQVADQLPRIRMERIAE